MTYTIKQLRELVEGTTPGPWKWIPYIGQNFGVTGVNFRFILASRTAVPELIAELEDLTRQLRAEEITGINTRVRTARECAEIAAKYSGQAMQEIREKFGVQGAEL